MTTTPNTPQELLSLNTNPEPELTDLELVQGLMETVGYEDTLKVVCWLTTNLLDFHNTRVDQLEGEPSQRRWVQDQTKLWTVLQLLKGVE